MLPYVFAASLAEAYLLGALRESNTRLLVTFLVLCIVNYSILTLYYIFIYPDFVSPLRGLPGPPGGRSIVGHMPAKFAIPKGIKIREWMETIPNDGVLRVKELFRADALIATSPETLKAVLSDHSYDYIKSVEIKRILRQILGDGLIVVEDDMHKFQRKRLLPPFGVGAIKDLYPLFWQKSTELAQRLSSSPDLARIAFGPWCSLVTLDIIGVAALGQDFGTLGNEENALAQSYNEVLNPDTGKQVWFMLSFLFPEVLVANIPFWSLPRLMNRIRGQLKDYARTLTSDRRKELASGISLESKAEALQLRRPDILSNLVRAEELSDSELASQVLTMMAAGHETTSSTLSWVAVLLSQHPEIQEELREEIRAHLPSPDLEETVTPSQFDKLHLLNAVCHETLRLYPTVPFSARTANKPTPLGGVTLPVGTQVWLPVWAINRSTQLWGKDAEEFRPSRWLTDGAFNNNGGANSNYCQLTFLHGPRSCIGQGFAKAELRCLVAAVVGRFRLELAEDISKYTAVGLVTIKPENDALLKMSIVEGW